jgi:hypothetical protein
MSNGTRARLVVERVDALPGRPWLFVSGRLADGELEVGSPVTIRYGEREPVRAVVRTIELHTRPGTTTIAIDRDLRDAIGPGAEVTATD